MGDTASRIRALSPNAELMIVVVVAFGWSILSSIEFLVSAWSGQISPWPPVTQAELIKLIAFQAVVLVVLGWFLRARGWTLAELGLDPSWRQGARSIALGVALRAAQGLVLAVALALVDWIHSTVIWALLGQRISTDAWRWAPDVAVAAILGFLVLNSIFEELFVCGYLISRLGDERGLWFALGVSTVIRLSYHLYQGLAPIPLHVATGLIFGYWFARTRQLWPLIFAHTYLNLLSEIGRT